MKKTLRRDAEKRPLENVLIIVMLAVGIVSFPTKEIAEWLVGNYLPNTEFIAVAICRIIFAGVMVFLALCYDFGSQFIKRPSWKQVLLVLPSFLVAINNAPYVALANGTADITANAETIAYFVLYCLAITAFEEITFRGVIFPLFILKFKKNKTGLFYAIVCSNAVFGLMHILNLISGAGVVPTILQVGYSFLIGCLATVVFLKTGSIYFPIALHFVYNVCGKMVGALGTGSFYDIWNTAQVVITVVLSVLEIVYVTYLFIKTDAKKMYKTLGFETETEVINNMDKTPTGEKEK